MDFKKLPNYQSRYSATKLFDKISKVAKKAGIKVVYAALLLYYALIDGNVPLKDKAIVIGALGYFILPLDFIPDLLGPLGYSDDASVLLYALKTIWDNITPETNDKAKSRLTNWFKEINPSDLKIF